jgi:hypothetical protein
MRNQKSFTKVLVSVFFVLFGSVTAQATDICGVIPTTLTIFDNSKLTCDVECLQTDNQACIRFGAPGIKLELNGFKMTGTANEPPRSNCITAGNFGAQQADGILSNFDEVVIEGPGVVQRMRRHGIALIGILANPFVEKATVKKLVSNQNCFSGIFMGGVNNSLVEEVVSARNSANSEFRPCGGVCVTNSNNNHVRRSEFFGNGTIALSGPPAQIPSAPAPPIPNDFGVGLVGSSSGNIIEENGIGGNINGVALFPTSATATPTGNVIRKNVILGNPPIEISAANPAIDPVGADIRDFSAAGSNRFEDNLCMTYTGLSPNPCLKLPQFSGHQNN